jgi:hypothetical protein
VRRYRSGVSLSGSSTITMPCGSNISAPLRKAVITFAFCISTAGYFAKSPGTTVASLPPQRFDTSTACLHPFKKMSICSCLFAAKYLRRCRLCQPQTPPFSYLSLQAGYQFFPALQRASAGHAIILNTPKTLVVHKLDLIKKLAPARVFKHAIVWGIVQVKGFACRTISNLTMVLATTAVPLKMEPAANVLFFKKLLLFMADRMYIGVLQYLIFCGNYYDKFSFSFTAMFRINNTAINDPKKPSPAEMRIISPKADIKLFL